MNIKYPYVNDEILNLDWILKQIQEFKDTLSSWSELAEQLTEALGDINDMKADITALKSSVHTLYTAVNQLESDVILLKSTDDNQQVMINDLYSKLSDLNDAMDLWNLRLNNIYSYLDSKLAVLANEISNQAFIIMLKMNQNVANLQAQIDILKEAIVDIPKTVINPWHGEVGNQENVNLTYADLADGCLTAEEYITLNLTASEYVAFDLTALEYARYSIKKLHYDWVYSPIYGFKQEISNVLTSIANYILGTLSASEYAALDLEADDYAALNLTAIDYLSYNVNGDGITAAEYEAINKLNSGILTI